MISPVVRFVLALIGGIIFHEAFTMPTWPIYLLGGIGLLLFLQGFIRRTVCSTSTKLTIQGIGTLVLFFTLGWLTTRQHTEATNPTNLIHLKDTVRAYEGIIVRQPEERAKTYRVELALRRGKTDKGWQPISGNVIVYLDKNIDSTTRLPLPTYGEEWAVWGSPRLIDPPLNPGELDYQRFLRYQNIYHQQYVRPYQRKILGIHPPNYIQYLAIKMNQWADSVFTHQVYNQAEYAIVNAMLLGSRDDLDATAYQSYATAGAIHILSVSGLHVSILFAALTWLVSLIKRKPKNKWLWPIIQLVILWFYAFMTGLQPAVLRSAGMFTVLIISKASDRPQQLSGNLAVSALFILFFSPYTLFSAGFQLSYLAVAGIGAWHPRLYQSITFKHRRINQLWELTSVAIVAQLITFPLAVFYFHQFPTYFLLANPIVLVLSNWLLYAGMATLAVSGIPYVNTLAGWVLQKIAWLLNHSVDLVSQLPGAAMGNLWFSPIELLLVYGLILIGVWLVITRKPIYLGYFSGLSLLLSVLLIYDYYEQNNQQKLAVHFLPHRTAISVIQGHKATLLTDLNREADPRSFDFYLKNTFSQWAISDLSIQRTDADSSVRANAIQHTNEYTVWVCRGKRILVVNKLRGRTFWRLPTIVDYLIIRKNALHDWQQLRGRVVARHIIFDDSNRTPLTDRLLAEAKAQGIICYSVRQQGAYITAL